MVEEEVQFEQDECREIIISENTADYFFRYEGNIQYLKQVYNPACIVPFSARDAVIYFQLTALERSRFVQLPYTYQVMPRCYGIMDQSSMEESGINRLHRQPYLDLYGQGVLIGFVDTGIEYTNSLFQYADKTTRIVSIWDQTIQTGSAPPLYGYGSEYTSSDINKALASENPLELVPSTDTNGHGTFLAGIAAGNEDIKNNYTGAAPLSELVVVKLKQAKEYLKEFYFIKDTADCYQENDIVLGINYLLGIAKKMERPLVICLGLGTSLGGHDGSGILDQYLDSLADSNGVCIVVAGGNESGYRTHYRKSGRIQERYEDVELRIGEGDKGFSMEFWAGSLQVYHMVIISPSGETSSIIGQRGRGTDTIRFLFDRTTVYADYLNSGAASGDQLIFLRFSEPASGIWTFRLYPQNDIDGYYDLWLPLHAFAWAETYFLEADSDITITDPGNSYRTITIAAYDHVSQSIYIHSGRGYTRNGIIKPNIAAPGVEVYGPGLGGTFTRKTGTSISAAHAAGAAALLLQWGIVDGNLQNMSSTEIRVLMIQGANRTGRSYPNREWGYGTLDIYQSFEQLRNTSFDSTFRL